MPPVGVGKEPPLRDVGRLSSRGGAAGVCLASDEGARVRRVDERRDGVAEQAGDAAPSSNFCAVSAGEGGSLFR